MEIKIVQHYLFSLLFSLFFFFWWKLDKSICYRHILTFLTVHKEGTNTRKKEGRYAISTPANRRT